MTTAASPAALIETHFGALKDPRATYRLEHKLSESPWRLLYIWRKFTTIWQNVTS
jgi:hypothetical protein